MNITALSNKWLNRAYKSIAILLVLFAVLISSLRLFLPYAQHYKIDLQNYINDAYGTQVEIGALSMDWQKFGPVLVAKNVSLIDTESVATFIENINIKVNFWRTLQHRTLITQGFTLDGAKIFVNQHGLENNTVSAKSADMYDRLSELFLLQLNKFSLVNSQLILRTESGDKLVHIDHLNWQNIGLRHRASGEIIAKGLSTNTVKLLLDLEGSELKQMSGQLYVNADKVNLTPWLDTVLALADEDTYSEVNFNYWLTIKNGKLRNAQLDIGESVLRWRLAAEEHQLSIARASLNADFTTWGVKLRSTPIELLLDNKPWQPLNLSVDFDALGQFDLYLSSLDVGGLSTLAPLVVSSPSLATLIGNLEPQGTLNDIYLSNKGKALSAVAKLDNYQQAFSAGIPGVQNVTAELTLNGQQLYADVNAVDASLDFDKHFPQPIPFDQINTQIQLSWNDEGLSIDANQVEFQSPSLALTAQVNVTVPTDTDATMSLLANIERGDAKAANYYFPHLLMGEKLVNYLNNSIIDGEVNRGQVLFNGAFKDFPFHHNQGIFVVDADVTNAEFQFDPHWPVINNLAANLNFTNNSMLITADAGELTGLNVKGVTAGIKELKGEGVLLVNADIHQQLPKNVTELMVNSPLAASVGKTLTALQVSQPISGDFQLALPLHHVKDVVASGTINLHNNVIDLTTPDMHFDQVNGQVSFRNEVVTAQALKVNWRNMPMTVAVTGENKPDYYQTTIGLTAGWQQEHWLAQVPERLKHWGSGELNWQGNIELNMHHDGGFSYNAAIESNLLDTDLTLPVPYQKTAQTPLTVVAKVNGQKDKSTITANVGDELSFFGVLDHEKTQFQRAHLVLGNEAMLLPMDGFHITTKLDAIEFASWHALVGDILASLPKQASGHPLLPAPDRIRGTVNQVALLGEQLNNVSFNLLDEDAWWLLRLNAKQMRGEVKFFPNWLEQGVEVDADFIHWQTTPDPSSKDLPEIIKSASALNIASNNANNHADENAQANAGSEVGNETDSVAKNADKAAAEPFNYQQELVVFNQFPPFELTCDSCKINDVDFGEVHFLVKRAGDQLLLKDFKAKRGKNRADLTGSWQLTPEHSVTSLTGNVTINDLERELESLGFASIVKDSGLKADYQLNWQGGPQQFSLPALNGELDISIDDGYLADVSDQGVRIFSVLSLQSLVRKLTLDFRDIFSDGMFYSAINSHAEIKDGVLYTDNMKMEGTAGDLSIKGNTVLADGLLDYRMSYKPNLTSSLPVLAWIATLNPVTFLAGVAIDQVFTSQVVSEINFELTGDVTDPILKEVNRKSRNVSVGRSTPPQFVENQSQQSDTILDDGKLENQKLNDGNNLPDSQSDKREHNDG
ncbi:YhdP family protein [Colwellia sp. MEBiC06753]